MTAKRSGGEPTSHRFGGEWTTTKLEVLEAYLHSYTTALKNKPSRERPFRKLYIDAFAGTGYRDARREPADAEGQGLLFPDLAEQDPQGLLDGSARLALKVSPRFDRYVFIEKHHDRYAQLEQLAGEFPESASAIEVRRGDANAEIRAICRQDWRSQRAVLFLDPYGMQVEWATIEAIARTCAIDLWVLFPLGIGVNRLLTRSGEIPDSWRRCLDLLLGTDDWWDAFYKVESAPSLFGSIEDRVEKATMDTIGRYFVKRLEGVFAGVAATPGVLRNSVNSPLYLLCFAVGNPNGKEVALRIANHLLRDLR